MIGNHPFTEFWKQIKRINSGSTCTASPSIDGITGDQNLAMMWKENYSQILNSVDGPTSPAILQSFEDANQYVKAEQYYCPVELVKILPVSFNQFQHLDLMACKVNIFCILVNLFICILVSCLIYRVFVKLLYSVICNSFCYYIANIYFFYTFI